MSSITATREYREAQRRLRNFASAIKRPNNWRGSLAWGYESSFRAVVAVEDRYGVEAAARLSDRLTELRHRAHLSVEDVIAAERAALR